MITEQFEEHSRWESSRVEPEVRAGASRKEGATERIEQRVEHQAYVARCAFEILGVTASPRTASPSLEISRSEQDRVLSSLVSVLGPGQSITFVYEGGGLRPLRWRIIGEAASSESSSQAGESLRNVRDGLLTVLESRKAYYRFKPVSAEKARRIGTANYKFAGSIQPHGTSVKHTKGRVGFGLPTDAPEQRHAAVCLPHYTRDGLRAFSSIVKLLASSPASLRLSVKLESCHLSQDQEHAIEAALNVIRGRHPGSELSARLENAASVWLKTLDGCRIKCAVWSSRPISESFLSILGGEIYYGGVDVCTRGAAKVRLAGHTSSRATPSPLLDLRDCIPSLFPLPPLFPQPDALARYGMRRFFNRERLVLPKAGILLGCVRDGHAEQKVRLCDRERSRHLYILGATGTGKSTLSYNLIMQDIHRGEGACLVDPHGDLYRHVRDSIPSNRVDDVVLLDPSDREWAVGINLLECNASHRDAQMNFLINELTKILDRLYDMRAVAGPVFEQFFRGALQLLMEDPNGQATLVDLPAVFENPQFRSALVNRSNNPVLADFWKMAEETRGEHALANLGPYITSKLNLFVHNALIRPIIGQPKSTVDFRTLMDNRGILLVNLARGALGELDTRLLGMVVLTKLISAAMSRLDVACNRRKPFMVFVDEFQNFTTDATASLLSESRKFGICLTLAHQNLAQLAAGQGQENLIHSVLGNVGSMVLFRLGAPDAEKLAIYTRPNFGPEDLQRLPNFHAASSLLTPTGPTDPFVFQTYPALRRRAESTVMRRMDKNRQQYSTSTKTVEANIRNRREAIRATASREG